MSKYYKTCEHCGANLDPGEKCDCGHVVPLYEEFNEQYIENITKLQQGSIFEHLGHTYIRQSDYNQNDVLLSVMINSRAYLHEDGRFKIENGHIVSDIVVRIVEVELLPNGEARAYELPRWCMPAFLDDFNTTNKKKLPYFIVLGIRQA